MEYNVVPLSFFTTVSKRLARLDAEYASPTLLAPEEQLRSIPGHHLRELLTGYNGPPVKSSLCRDYVLHDYISIDCIDVDDGLIYPNRLLYKDLPTRAKYVVESGDVLVSNVRPNRGGIAFISDRTAGSIASSGFTLLRLDPSEAVNPLYLFAFLKTTIARQQLIRRNRGSMYPAVLKEDVEDVWIPSAPTHIHATVREHAAEAVKLHDAFFEKYIEQAAMLEDFLQMTCGEPPPSPLDSSRLEANVSIEHFGEFFGETSAARFDAEFFRREYAQFDRRIQKAGPSFLLGDYYTTATGRSPGEPVGEVPYLRQSVLTNAGINWSAVSYDRGDTRPETGRVHSGDILLACTAHEIYYVGRKVDFVRHVPSHLRTTNCCVADILIIRPAPEKPETLNGSYLAACLRSPWGLHQVQRCIRGLRGGHVYGRDLKRFVRLPFPQHTWLNEFEEISREAETKRDLARRKMREAIDLFQPWLEPLLQSE